MNNNLEPTPAERDAWWRGQVQALASDLWRATPCGCGHRADMHTVPKYGNETAVCVGLGICGCDWSYTRIIQHRLTALLDAVPQPETTPSDTPSIEDVLAAHPPTHTEHGPLYCPPCSEAIGQWVQWTPAHVAQVLRKAADLPFAALMGAEVSDEALPPASPTPPSPVTESGACVRCSVEEGRIERATLRALHPTGFSSLPVCDRHGADLLANGWTRVTQPGSGESR